jgi:hypothetical protein
MGVADFVKAAFNSSLDVLSAENVTIGAATARGVVEDIGAELMIADGGDENRRGLRVSFPSAAFATVPTSRQTATCRSKTWKIDRVDNGPGALVLDLIEPERRG